MRLRAHRRPWLLALALSCACTPGGCPPGGGDGGLPDGGLPDGAVDAGVDGGPPDAAMDASTDAAFDSGIDASADAAVDSGTDAAVDAASDAALDASTDAATCAGSGECVTAAWVGPACVETPVDDGTTCGESLGGVFTHVCVAGACVPRGCGDGFREPGPMPAREGCDDGNVLAGDACDPSCVPTPLVVSSVADGEDRPSGPAASVGLTPAGAALFVWSALRLPGAGTPGAEATQAILARPTSAAGVPLRAMDSPIVVAADVGAAWRATPTVVGRPEGGWLVAWTAPDVLGDPARSDIGSVVYRQVNADFSLGALRFAAADGRGFQHQPALASSSSVAALSWRDEAAALSGPPGHSDIRLRLLSPASAACASEQVVSTLPGDHSQPGVAVGPTSILVTWTDAGIFPPLATEVPVIVGRRYDLEGCALDAMPFQISDVPAGPLEMGELPPSGLEPSVAALGSGDFAVAWVDRTSDARGDVRARVVFASGPALDMAPSFAIAVTPARAERRPSVTSAGAADFLVLHARGDVGASLLRDAELAPVGFSLPPEVTALRALLGPGAIIEDAAVLHGPRGTWVTFSDDGALGDPGAFHSFLAYLLPESG